VEQNAWTLRGKKKRFTIVDLGLPKETPRILDYIRTLNGDVKEVFLTHPHVDHVGNVELVRKSFPGVKISTHKNLPPGALSRTRNMVRQIPTAVVLGSLGDGSFSDFVHLLKSPLKSDLHIDRNYMDGEPLDSNRRFVVMSTPGHTRLDASLYSRTKGVLISGDSLVSPTSKKIFAIRQHAEDPKSQVKTVQKLKGLRISHFFPGLGVPVIARDRRQKGTIQDRIDIPEEVSSKNPPKLDKKC